MTVEALHLRFIDRLAAHDWDGLATTVADAMEWHGPNGDRVHRGPDYVERIRGTVGRLEDYRIDVVRELRSGDFAVVEMVQRFRVGDHRRVVPEVMVFDLEPGTGRVARLAVYIKEPDKE